MDMVAAEGYTVTSVRSLTSDTRVTWLEIHLHAHSESEIFRHLPL